MKITITLPYIRPAKAANCLKLARERSGIPDENLLILKEYDKKRRGCPKTLKRLVQRSKTDLVCFIGDDCEPQQDFLKYALEDMAEFEGGWGLVGLNDNTGRSLITHWLAHKKLLPFIGGEFFHTGYTHVCCDVELQERASAISRVKMSKRAFVLHDHPILKGEPTADADYLRVYSNEVRTKDRILFLQRKAREWR